MYLLIAWNTAIKAVEPPSSLITSSILSQLDLLLCESNDIHESGFYDMKYNTFLNINQHSPSIGVALKTYEQSFFVLSIYLFALELKKHYEIFS